MLVEYVKDKKGSRVGVVVALDKDSIGWSKCKTKPSADPFKPQGFNKFNKERALEIAIGRAKTMRYTVYLSPRPDKDGRPYPLNTPIPKTTPPRDVQKVIEHVKARAKAYFKELRIDSGEQSIIRKTIGKKPVPTTMRDILADARKERV